LGEPLGEPLGETLGETLGEDALVFIIIYTHFIFIWEWCLQICASTPVRESA
jgi:hypothetical protein